MQHIQESSLLKMAVSALVKWQIETEIHLWWLNLSVSLQSLCELVLQHDGAMQQKL